jgi:hypothetical protein
MNEWMNYFPDFMSPFGMFFYSLIAYLLIFVYRNLRRRTVEDYIQTNLSESVRKGIEENRKKKTQ